MSEVPSVEDVQKLLSRGPYHQWLGLKVIAVGEGTIELTAAWVAVLALAVLFGASARRWLRRRA